MGVIADVLTVTARASPRWSMERQKQSTAVVRVSKREGITSFGRGTGDKDSHGLA